MTDLARAKRIIGRLLRDRDRARRGRNQLRLELSRAEAQEDHAHGYAGELEEERDQLRADLAEARARIDKARKALDYDLRPLKAKPEKYDAIWRTNQRAYLALIGAGGMEVSDE